MAAFFRNTTSLQHRTIMLVLINFLLLVFVCQAVDRNNFKSCDQSGFCKRQRDYKPDTSPYIGRTETLSVSNDGASFEIYNKQAQIEFVMRLTGYDNGIVRIHMNEKTPIRPRYEVPPGDVVLEQTIHPFTKDSVDSSSFALSLLGTTIVKVQANPFLLEVYSHDVLLVQMNSRQLLKFEHLRSKPSEAEPPENDRETGEGEGETNPEPQPHSDEAEPEEHALWDEKYKTHEDSKPNGPSSIGIDLSFIGYENVYGIPEHADHFSLRSTQDTDPYRLYNLDVFEYELDSPMALYGSVPFMIAHNPKTTCGIFWNNPSEMWIDVSNSLTDRSTLGKIVSFVTQDNKVQQMDTRWIAESGVLDLYFVPGPTPADVFRQYGQLTGVTPLPPIFAISYHQCRWNYNDEPDVKQIHDNFDLHDIPLDVVWLDIEHTDGKRYFTWDPSRFPTPLNMVQDLTSKGRRLVTIVDPHLKRDSGYAVYQTIRDNDMFVKDRNGNEYDGWCWPGSSSYPDFTRPDMRKLWAEKFLPSHYTGTTIDGVYTWNDMNEPSVFNGPEITMHKDAKHAGDWEHRDVHNLYGMYVHQATTEGQYLRSGGTLRPFVLSRAFYAGSQRSGAVWTGDNTGEWGHLYTSVSMILSQSITGITLTGADVGGFFKNPSTQLTTRWYQMGAFSPFFRAHSHPDTRRREPWLLPDENRDVIRDAIATRYALLPYWYTLFYENEVDGMPPVRPLWAEFPADVKTFKEQEQFMLGSGILVHPVLHEQVQGVDVYFPTMEGQDLTFYDADTHAAYRSGTTHHIVTPLSKIPYFYRSGSIITRKDRLRRSSTQMVDDPYTLIVAVHGGQSARGTLYIDDYKSFEYRSGEFIYRELLFESNVLKSSSKSSVNSSFRTKSTLEKLVFIGVERAPGTITLSIDGATRELTFTHSGHTLVIRKPDVNMGDNWTISLN